MKEREVKRQRGFTLVELMCVVLVLIGAGGWIANVVKIAGTGFADFNGMLIARCIGVFIAPLGAVLGFL